MTVWLTFIAVGVLTGIISWWMITHAGPDDRRWRDPDWGDWPSDQMGP